MSESPQLEAQAASSAEGTTNTESVWELRQRIGELEKTLKIKNNHIIYLENLVGRLENGRIMRLLRLFSR